MTDSKHFKAQEKRGVMWVVAVAAIVLVNCAIFYGCTAGDGDTNNDQVAQSATAFTLTATTDDGGAAVVSFDVAQETTKFSVTASVGRGAFVRFDRVRDGDGNDYLHPGRETISFGEELSPFNNVVSIPSRGIDPPVDASQRFTVNASAARDENGATPLVGETITFSINSKADPNLSQGPLRVNIFLVGDVGQQQSTLDITQAAEREFERIYASSAGIDVNIQELQVDGPVVIPRPDLGNSFYRSATGGVPSPGVNIFIGGDIADFGSGNGGGDVLGIAASIPGPPISSERSAVAVSIFAGAGPDGVYSNEEVRILGETLAHELGHFMGLFHPVDFDGGSVAASDPLTDTPVCSFITQCVSDESLIRNLMFPSPVADGQGGFVPQNELTRQQQEVMNRYVAVD